MNVEKKKKISAKKVSQKIKRQLDCYGIPKGNSKGKIELPLPLYPVAWEDESEDWLGKV